MRRLAPRPLSSALARTAEKARPATLLARVQAVWDEAVGTAVATEAQPASERGGTVLVGCSSAVWAQELELLEPDLLERLNASLAPEPGGEVKTLRFRVDGRP